jgi:hypothetical protein
MVLLLGLQFKCLAMLSKSSQQLKRVFFTLVNTTWSKLSGKESSFLHLWTMQCKCTMGMEVTTHRHYNLPVLANTQTKWPVTHCSHRSLIPQIRNFAILHAFPCWGDYIQVIYNYQFLILLDLSPLAYVYFLRGGGSKQWTTSYIPNLPIKLSNLYQHYNKLITIWF